MKSIEDILNRIAQTCCPKSIFIFGSRVRNDYLNKSDWEIGVLFDKKNYIREDKLNCLAKPPPNIHIYPYYCDKFIKGDVDIPFQRNIFLREVVITGKTMKGEKIIEKIVPPSINVIDLKEDLKFSIARGSDAIISYRNDNKKTASILFYKSCLYGTRVLIILSLKKFPISYLEIYQLSKKINLKKEYKELIQSAFSARHKGRLNPRDLFTNISYLNKFIENKLNIYYKRLGNKILID